MNYSLLVILLFFALLFQDSLHLAILNLHLNKNLRYSKYQLFLTIYNFLGFASSVFTLQTFSCFHPLLVSSLGFIYIFDFNWLEVSFAQLFLNFLRIKKEVFILNFWFDSLNHSAFTQNFECYLQSYFYFKYL